MQALGHADGESWPLAALHLLGGSTGNSGELLRRGSMREEASPIPGPCCSRPAPGHGGSFPAAEQRETVSVGQRRGAKSNLELVATWAPDVLPVD